jgi:hypothetical protein
LRPDLRHNIPKFIKHRKGDFKRELCSNKYLHLKKKQETKHQWLAPVKLATQKAETRRIRV